MEAPNSIYTEEPKRYYWIMYMDNEKTVAEDVTDKHPFQHIDELNGQVAGEYYCLINWKKIEVEEYIMWNELNN